MTHSRAFFFPSVCSALAVALLAGGCGDKPVPGPVAAGVPSGAPATKLPGVPVAVTTVLAQGRDMDVTLETIGTVTPLSSVEVKPQISSVVTRVHIQEGQFVKAGDLLFTLDPRPEQANVAKLRAQMAKDEAVLADAQRQLARSRDLMSQHFVSKGALDSSQAQVDAQMANLLADRAAVDAAQLALSYHSVRASSAGRLGAVAVYPGTAVQANLTPLVTITQLHPVNVSFSLPQRNLDGVLEGLKSGGMAVSVQLPESGDRATGRLQFVDSTVDAATGTVKVRARFDNPMLQLWPGAFVKVALVTQTLKNAVVIPTASVIQSPRGSVVYVADQGKAALRPVKVLAVQGEESAVTGIAAGDRVVWEGRQNLRPDSPLLERAPDGAQPVRAAASSAP